MWGALRPAIRRTNAEELLQARQAERQANRQAVEPAPNTGAFGRIAADVPSVAEEPDLPTGSVPVVPARSKLREQGVGSRVRTRTNVSTGFVPLVRDSQSTPKNPTLSDLNRETMQRAAEAEATASAPATPSSTPAADAPAQVAGVATAEAATTTGNTSRTYRTETTRTGQNQTVADPNAPLSSLTRGSRTRCGPSGCHARSAAPAEVARHAHRPGRAPERVDDCDSCCRLRALPLV